MRELAQFSEPELRKELSRRRKARKEVKRKAHGEPKRRKGMGVRIGDRDEAEKLRRGYVEAGSFVRRDGSEKLVGSDWRKRKREIWERGEGRCEKVFYDWDNRKRGYAAEEIRCKSEMHDPHHKVKRSNKRDDRAENLIGLCRLHHDLLDPRKVRSSKDGA